jgi:hypothetical protein
MSVAIMHSEGEAVGLVAAIDAAHIGIAADD